MKFPKYKIEQTSNIEGLYCLKVRSCLFFYRIDLIDRSIEVLKDRIIALENPYFPDIL